MCEMGDSHRLCDSHMGRGAGARSAADDGAARVSARSIGRALKAWSRLGWGSGVHVVTSYVAA
jgi:hypothetical protein